MYYHNPRILTAYITGRWTLLFGTRKRLERHRRKLERIDQISIEKQRFYVNETNNENLPQWVPKPLLCWVAIDEHDDKELRAVVYASPRCGDGVPVYTDILGDRWLYAEPIKQEA